MKIEISIVIPDGTPKATIDAFAVGVKNIARAMFGACTVITRGDLVESIPRIDPVGNSFGRYSWRSLPVLRVDNDDPSGEGEALVRDSVHRVRGRRFRGGPWVDTPPEPESGSDRLSGPPEGIPEERGKHMAGLHRGRRRRLLARLKRVSAGTRFRR